MLHALPRVRSVVEISYGCMGFSVRQARTARASGFDTRRRVMTPPPVRLLESHDSEVRRRQDLRATAGAAMQRHAVSSAGSGRAWTTARPLTARVRTTYSR